MKKILSFILVICMLMTVAPVAVFAQTADFTFKPEAATYTAKVGEPVSVPFLLVPSAESVSVQFFSLSVEPSDGLTISEIAAGKIPVSNSNGVNLANNKALIAYDNAVTLTPSDAVLFTLNCTATKAGTYSLSTIIDELYDENYDVIGDASNVALQNATITFEAEGVVDPAGADACALKKNSTYITGEQFEYADVAAAGTDVKDAGIEGLSVARSGDGSEDTYVKIVADPANEGDYALETYHPGTAKSQYISQVVTETLDADVDSDYVVMSHKFWYPAGTYIRFYPTFTFTHNTDSSKVLKGSGFSAIIKNTVSQEGALAGTHTYAGKWTEWDFVINTKTLKADLYIDHVYDLTFDMTTGANGTKNLTTDYHLSKINDYTWRFDRTSGAGSAYFDDIQIRSMTAAQYAAAFANETITVEGTSITTADLLPVRTTGFGLPITWTTNNADVTVDANGAISVADATVTYEDVVFTASFAGNTKTFTLDVKKQAKYAEYTFGAKEDKAYGMTSFNVADNYYTQEKDGLTIRNSIVKFDEQRTLYFVADDKTSTSDTAASHEVTKDEYDAYDGLKKMSYNVVYYNTSAKTGDSAMNRYDAVGPDGDKRAAVWGVGHLRNDTRLSRKWTNSMIHFDTGSTFSATDNALVIEVDVLDVGTHAINLQYCNNAGAIAGVNSAALTNSGEWITIKYELTDANFAWTANTGLGNNKQDMRFQISQPTYISAVRIYDVEPVEVAEADYTKIAVADYDVMINEDNTITAKTAITAEEAADAKLYVAYYNAKGNLVGVATSAQATDGVAQTLVTGKSVGATYNTVDYTLKTFVWDADLKPLR